MNHWQNFYYDATAEELDEYTLQFIISCRIFPDAQQDRLYSLCMHLDLLSDQEIEALNKSPRSF